MQTLKLDRFDSLESLLNKNLNGEEILYRFEIVPLDYKIVDLTTPEFVLTKTRLFFLYDQTIETYNLNEIELEVLGGEPKFKFWQQLTEQSLYYTRENINQIQEIKKHDGWIKLVITPDQEVPKDFLLRQGGEISKSYKTWAMYRIIKNIQQKGEEAKEENTQLEGMVAGNFSYFNKKIMILFIFIFVVYVIIRVISQMFLPEIAINIMQYVFMAGILGFLAWIILTQERNNKHFLRVYQSYKK